MMWVWSKLSAIKWSDAWEERFYGNPNAVITEIKGGKSIRVEVYCEVENEALEIQSQFGGSVRGLKSRDWVAMSAPKTEPLLIRNRLVISQVDLSANEFPDRQVIVVPPEMAFGTGDHPTTATCLRLLVDQSNNTQEGWSFLDLGTGSGVLAMAAKLLGAGLVRGFDFDPKAVEVANRNLKRNKIEEVDLFEADVFQWDTDERFQVVAANLFSTVLVDALPRIEKWLSSPGHLLLSGILADQWNVVKQAADSTGLEFLSHHPKGKWVTAEFRKS